MTVARTLVAALCGWLVALPSLAESRSGVTVIAPATAAEKASLDLLVEHTLSTQLKRCDGVEVHRRGSGWLAGTVGGPIVTVTGEGDCRVLRKPGAGLTAEVTVHWQTFNVETRARVASFRRTVSFNQDRCPADFMSPALTASFGKQHPRVCNEAFVPLREPFSLSTVLAPALLPLGTVRDVEDSDGATALELVVDGRAFRLSGTITCQDTSDELEGSLFGDMRAFNFVGALSLSEPVTRERLGQWNETLFRLNGIRCPQALGVKANEQKVSAFQQAWRTRIGALVGKAPVPSP